MKWHVKPKNKVDEISAQHDICYDMGTADSSPVVSLSVSPYWREGCDGKEDNFLPFPFPSPPAPAAHVTRRLLGTSQWVRKGLNSEQLDSIPYRDMTNWGMIARTIINNKQKLDLGVGSSCRSLVDSRSLRFSKKP